MSTYINSDNTVSKININILISSIPLVMLALLTYKNSIVCTIFSILISIIIEILARLILKQKTDFFKIIFLGIMYLLISPLDLKIHILAITLIIGIIIEKISKFLFKKTFFNQLMISYLLLIIYCTVHNVDTTCMLLKLDENFVFPALLFSLIYLTITKSIKYRISVTTIVLLFAISKINSSISIIFCIFTGIYLLNDLNTTPIISKNQIIFSVIFCLLVFVFNIILSFEFSVIISTLLSNMLSPILDSKEVRYYEKNR